MGVAMNLAAPENSGRPGPPEGKRFQKGQSGNPGGRPSGLKTFRQECRDAAHAIVSEIKSRVQSSMGEMSIRELVEGLNAVADRGGYLPDQSDAQAEATKLRALVEALALETLTGEQRKAMLDDYRKREAARAAPEPEAQDA